MLSIRSLYDVLIVGGRMRRRFGFSSLVIMRFISIYLRTYSTNKIQVCFIFLICDKLNQKFFIFFIFLKNFNDLILQELYPIFGALVSAWHFPEVIYPGIF